MKKLTLFAGLFLFCAAHHAVSQCTDPPGDFDNDGVADAADLDDDNDGIPDSSENGQGTVSWTAAQLAAFRATPFSAALGCGTTIGFQANPLNSQFGSTTAVASSTVNYATVLSTDMGGSFTLPHSLGISTSAPNNTALGNVTMTLTPGTLNQLNLYFSDAEYTSFVITAYDAADNLLPTTDWCTAAYTLTGGSPGAAVGPPTINSTNVAWPATGAASSFFTQRVRIGPATLLSATRVVVSMSRYTGGNTAGDGLFFFFGGICRPDTDGDTHPNSRDNDSDGDGCPDALEGGAAFTYASLNGGGQLTAAVDAQGLPAAAGVPQSQGASNNASAFDAQSACELPQSVDINYTVNGTPGVLNLGGRPFLGSDGTDQPSQGSWSGKAVRITALPTSGFVLKYNAVDVTLNQVISNYDPAQLTLEPGSSTPAGTVTTNFAFTVVDAIGQPSLTASTYTVTWTTILAATLRSFGATVSPDCKVLLSWEAENESGLKNYIIEQSPDGRNFRLATVVPKNAASGGYSVGLLPTPTAAVYYYRLKMVKLDGQTGYSGTVPIRFDCSGAINVHVFPNPAVSTVTVSGLAAGDRLLLHDSKGRLLSVKSVDHYGATNMDVAQLAAGVYQITILQPNGGVLKKLFSKQ